jgi:hypothetical protein
MTRLASNEIFSPSIKIHRDVGRAKDLSAPLYSGLQLKSELQHTGILPAAACIFAHGYFFVSLRKERLGAHFYLCLKLRILKLPKLSKLGGGGACN